MQNKILYLGDTSLKTAASYLAGVMTHAGIDFDYLPTDVPLGKMYHPEDYSAIIISDYPAENLLNGQSDTIINAVNNNTALLMIGGWESFTGLAGNYAQSPIAKILPVNITPQDDRINCPQLCVPEKLLEHPIIESMPFDLEPPTIGGYNKFTPKHDAQTILAARRFKLQRTDHQYDLQPIADPDPLLVVSTKQKARTACLATDAAPHWVGGFVDWGKDRITAQAPNAEQIEVGSLYAKFFIRLILWLTKEL